MGSLAQEGVLQAPTAMCAVVMLPRNQAQVGCPCRLAHASAFPCLPAEPHVWPAARALQEVAGAGGELQNTDNHQGQVGAGYESHLGVRGGGVGGLGFQ